MIKTHTPLGFSKKILTSITVLYMSTPSLELRLHLLANQNQTNPNIRTSIPSGYQTAKQRPPVFCILNLKSLLNFPVILFLACNTTNIILTTTQFRLPTNDIGTKRCDSRQYLIV
jgi:hypothetical protein